VDDLTFCVTAFERPAALTKLLSSVRARYPETRIIVADQSFSPARTRSDVEDLTVDFDIGVAAARNLLLDRVETPFVMFLDDDFVFTRDTRVEELRQVLIDHSDVDIAAGMVLSRGGREGHYEGLLEVDADGVLRYRKGNRGHVDGMPIVDIAYNFFAARTERIREIRWDPELKLAEHSEFFYRAKGRLKVVYRQTVKVAHPESVTPVYIDFRARGIDYARLFLRKHGLTAAVGFKGEELRA